VIEKLTKECRIELFHAQLRRHAPETVCSETEQQTKGIPVACHSVLTGTELPEQPVREETLK
jgi:hypothetical protein